ncbi:AAA family ATPase [Pseudoalteromonas sp. MMG013]|uniref:AAA family ATPase n=1 Tax=Pseudoalteromonas sp. MMG013 TaxID=2822687 RepID=UPI001B3932D9|nr:AAA family ATPase [Pseudoalteromonas sp. MMG013]MBQ4864402.1 AAA family ATPase [Pseudoalteromonas sp. MMG013]
MTTFNEHYSEQQILQIQRINEEIHTYELSPFDYAQGWDLESVKKVLAGRSPINPKKVVDALWLHFFDDLNPTALTTEANGSIYSNTDLQLAAKIRARLKQTDIKEQGISSADIARKLNKTPGAISQIINGKYAASPEKHLHDIWALVEPASIEVTKEAKPNEQKHIRIRYGEVPFVNTSVAKMIELACEHAKERRRFSVFAGQAGLGKSKGIKAYCEKHPDTILIDGSEQTSSTQVLEEICVKLGLPKNGSAYKNMNKIINALADSERLIILDESDKCKPNALDPLRTISDKARIGITLVGNIQLIDKLQSQERFELIASRVCFWPRPYGEMPVDDIKTLFFELTQNTVSLSEDDEKWWQWLHKRVEGNARLLVENLLPHILSWSRKNKNKKLDRLTVNSIFSTVLNKPAI